MVLTRRLTTLERAFELARSGTCRSVSEVRTVLQAERYEWVIAHTAGKYVLRQLNAEIEQSRQTLPRALEPGPP